MDRSWIKGVRRLSAEHTKGVEEFMQFVRRSAAEDAHVLCPCRSCLNRAQQPLGTVEAHLLIYGMASTYDRWVYHGEPLHAEPEPEPEPDADPHHVDEGNDFVQDDRPAGAGFEEGGNEDDRIPELLKDSTIQNRKVIDIRQSLPSC